MQPGLPPENGWPNHSPELYRVGHSGRWDAKDGIQWTLPQVPQPLQQTMFTSSIHHSRLSFVNYVPCSCTLHICHHVRRYPDQIIPQSPWAMRNPKLPATYQSSLRVNSPYTDIEVVKLVRSHLALINCNNPDTKTVSTSMTRRLESHYFPRSTEPFPIDVLG